MRELMARTMRVTGLGLGLGIVILACGAAAAESTRSMVDNITDGTGVEFESDGSVRVGEAIKLDQTDLMQMLGAEGAGDDPSMAYFDELDQYDDTSDGIDNHADGAFADLMSGEAGSPEDQLAAQTVWGAVQASGGELEVRKEFCRATRDKDAISLTTTASGDPKVTDQGFDLECENNVLGACPPGASLDETTGYCHKEIDVACPGGDPDDYDPTADRCEMDVPIDDTVVIKDIHEDDFVGPAPDYVDAVGAGIILNGTNWVDEDCRARGYPFGWGDENTRPFEGFNQYQSMLEAALLDDTAYTTEGKDRTHIVEYEIHRGSLGISITGVSFDIQCAKAAPCPDGWYKPDSMDPVCVREPDFEECPAGLERNGDVCEGYIDTNPGNCSIAPGDPDSWTCNEPMHRLMVGDLEDHMEITPDNAPGRIEPLFPGDLESSICMDATMVAECTQDARHAPPVEGGCEMEAAPNITCPARTTYNEDEELCVATPDEREFCPQGSSLADDPDGEGQRCIAEPEIETVCPDGWTAGTTEGQCIQPAEYEVYCPDGATYTGEEAGDGGLCEMPADVDPVCEGETTYAGAGRCSTPAEFNPDCPDGYWYEGDEDGTGACHTDYEVRYECDWSPSDYDRDDGAPDADTELVHDPDLGDESTEGNVCYYDEYTNRFVDRNVFYYKWDDANCGGNTHNFISRSEILKWCNHYDTPPDSVRHFGPDGYNDWEPYIDGCINSSSRNGQSQLVYSCAVEYTGCSYLGGSSQRDATTPDGNGGCYFEPDPIRYCPDNLEEYQDSWWGPVESCFMDAAPDYYDIQCPSYTTFDSDGSIADGACFAEADYDIDVCPWDGELVIPEYEMDSYCEIDPGYIPQCDDFYIGDANQLGGYCGMDGEMEYQCPSGTARAGITDDPRYDVCVGAAQVDRGCPGDLVEEDGLCLGPPERNEADCPENWSYDADEGMCVADGEEYCLDEIVMSAGRDALEEHFGNCRPVSETTTSSTEGESFTSTESCYTALDEYRWDGCSMERTVELGPECPDGTTYNDQRQECVAEIDAAAGCPAGTEPVEDELLCVAEPDGPVNGYTPDCPAGTYEGDGSCAYEATVTESCPDGGTLDADTGTCTQDATTDTTQDTWTDSFDCSSGGMLGQAPPDSADDFCTAQGADSGTLLNEGCEKNRGWFGTTYWTGQNDYECATTTETVTCPSGWTLDGQTCTQSATSTIECPEGGDVDGEQCLVDVSGYQPECPDDTEYEGDAQPYEATGECVADMVAGAICPAFSTYNEATGDCIGEIDFTVLRDEWDNAYCVDVFQHLAEEDGCSGEGIVSDAANDDCFEFDGHAVCAGEHPLAYAELAEAPYFGTKLISSASLDEVVCSGATEGSSTCTPFEEDDGCELVDTSCPISNIHGVLGSYCDREENTYECTNDTPPDTRVSEREVLDCEGTMVECEDDVCYDVEQQSNDGFGEFVAQTQMVQALQNHAECDESGNCEVFRGKPRGCRQLMGGMDYFDMYFDCCAMQLDMEENPVEHDASELETMLSLLDVQVTSYIEEPERLLSDFVVGAGTNFMTSMIINYYAPCEEEEYRLAVNKEFDAAVHIGRSCEASSTEALVEFYQEAGLIGEDEVPDIPEGMDDMLCLVTKENYCTFASPLARIMVEEGREQLNRPFGEMRPILDIYESMDVSLDTSDWSVKSDFDATFYLDESTIDCSGLTPSEVAQVDWSQVDLGEWKEILFGDGGLPSPSDVEQGRNEPGPAH